MLPKQAAHGLPVNRWGGTKADGNPPPPGQEGFQKGAIVVVHSAGTANTMMIKRLPNNGSLKSGLSDSAYALRICLIKR